MLKRLLIVATIATVLFGTTSCSMGNAEENPKAITQEQVAPSNTYINENNLDNANISGWLGEYESYIKDKGFSLVDVPENEIPEGAPNFTYAKNDKCNIYFSVDYIADDASNSLYSYILQEIYPTSMNGKWLKFNEFKLQAGEQEVSAWENIYFRGAPQETGSKPSTNTGSEAEEVVISNNSVGEIILWNNTLTGNPYQPGDRQFHQLAKAGISCNNDDINYIQEILEEIKQIDN